MASSSQKSLPKRRVIHATFSFLPREMQPSSSVQDTSAMLTSALGSTCEPSTSGRASTHAERQRRSRKQAQLDKLARYSTGIRHPLSTMQPQQLNSDASESQQSNLMRSTTNSANTESVPSSSVIVERINTTTSAIEATETTAATAEFKKSFLQQEFGHACSCCDRLWFQRDLRPAGAALAELLQIMGVEIQGTQLCAACRTSLQKKRIPTFAIYNGFCYPPIPDNLPPLNPITTRLISPRIPFMQIRRLRHAVGSYAILGQIINIPVDVQEMVTLLPRQLSEDFAFNVNFKKRLVHKTSAYSGLVKKRDVRAWLDYLQTSPLYQHYNITVDWPNFDINSSENDQETLEAIDDNNENELLLANQHTVLWSEEQQLDIAPGQKSLPLSIIYDTHAEELSFPAIYYGVPRNFREGVTVTPYQIASSELRRRDRRGTTPEHLLYMAMKILRLRVSQGLHASFRYNGDLTRITREMIENRYFMEECVEKNFAFLKSIPNSVQYWSTKKKDLFAMIRQLGKPTFFLTMSANEVRWPHLLNILHKLRHNSAENVADPLRNFTASMRANLVNEDAVTCSIYFWKLISTILRILQSPRVSPFGSHHVVDYFLRTEFQARGSPHCHLLIWLKNAPEEPLGEQMPLTIALIDKLCTVDVEHAIEDQLYSSAQIHTHTFTCYKNEIGGQQKTSACRFQIPYWPCRETRILLPMSREDGRRNTFRKRALELKKILEETKPTSFEHFLAETNLTYDMYLDIIRASLKRPTVLFKRDLADLWTNTFNSWIANTLKANMDLQFILEEYSCASYVVEYINKTNRGMSNLQRHLAELQTDYPEQDYNDLLKRVSLKMLDAVEMSSTEAAWYLLRQPMSVASREIMFITTLVPNQRIRTHKKKRQMEAEGISPTSTDVWTSNIFEKYEQRPQSLSSLCLAEFAADMSPVPGKRDSDGKQIYSRREVKRVLRWNSYDASDITNYKRSMVLLFYPFRNEHVELLDNDRFLTLYEQYESEIQQRKAKFEKYTDFERTIAENRELWEALADERCTEIERNEPERSLFENTLNSQANDDIRQLPINDTLISVVRKRTNVLSAVEYCSKMRCTNFEQRALIKHCIARIHDPEVPPIQLFFTGPAGCGKTFTLKLLMETYNRFAKAHDNSRDVFVAAASTGKAAVAIGGTTVHSAFTICVQQRHGGLSFEALQLYRNVFSNVHVVFIDEISMIGAGVFHTINERLKNITGQHEIPFGGLDILFCGDLRQLPPVRTSAIYEPIKRGLHRSASWQTLRFYPLKHVMRQSDITFSNLLTKIGNGDHLTNEEQKLLETRFRTKQWCDENVENAIRLFHRNSDVDSYNNNVRSDWKSIATDTYAGYRDQTELSKAQQRVSKMSLAETVNMPGTLPLALNEPYMITSNIDVIDGLVNGAIGILRFIDFEPSQATTSSESSLNTDSKPQCLWLEFMENPQQGQLSRSKSRPLLTTRSNFQATWTPIFKRTVSFPACINKTTKCRRQNFPLTLARAITVHKSQGATFDTVVFDYSGTMQQQLVYVALSRVKSLQGLYLTSAKGDFTFYHSKPVVSPTFTQLRNELDRLNQHHFETLDQQLLKKFTDMQSLLLNFNVQSLRAHALDLTSDQVLMQATVYCFTETWLPNATVQHLDNLRLCTQNKRPTRTGGVAIYSKASIETSENRNSEISLTDDDEGDLCVTELIIHGRKIRFACVYLNPGISVTRMRQFFVKFQTVIDPPNENNDVTPLILCGDFNMNLKENSLKEALETFMSDRFDLTLMIEPAQVTTIHSTCIDLVFSRNMGTLTSLPHISYFSYHKPIFVTL